MVGALPAAVGRTLLGAGVGYGLGAISTGNRKARRMGAVLGGAAGTLASYPDLYGTIANGRNLIDKWPYDQPVKYDSSAPVPGQNPVDAFEPDPLNFSPKIAGQDVGWAGVAVRGSLRDKVLELVNSIDADDLFASDKANDGADGRELDPHVTLLYGLHAKDSDPIEDAIADHTVCYVKLGDLSLFKQDDCDVLKFEIESGECLHELHNCLKELPNSETYPEYKPHVTVAYLKKGCGEKYLEKENALKGERFRIDHVRYSPPGDAEAVEFELAPVSTRLMPKAASFADRAVFGGWDSTHITPQAASRAVLNDPSMSVDRKAVAFAALNEAAEDCSRPSGLISLGDIARGAMGAGIGYGLASAVAGAVGRAIGLPTSVQKAFAVGGGLGGFNAAFGR